MVSLFSLKKVNEILFINDDFFPFSLFQVDRTILLSNKQTKKIMIASYEYIQMVYDMNLDIKIVQPINRMELELNSV